jgi:hypothetical protein
LVWAGSVDASRSDTTDNRSKEFMGDSGIV